MITVDGSMLSRWASTEAQREALYDGRFRMSYAEVECEAAKLAVFLKKRGINAGSRVLTCLPNCCEIPVLFFALEKLSAVMIPVNYLSKERDIVNVVELYYPDIAFFSDETHAAVFRQLCPEKDTILLDVDSDRSAFCSLTENDVEENFDADTHDAPLLLVSTSGSTGKPKGVLLSKRNIFSPAEDISQGFRFGKDDVTFVPVPLCHMLGIMGMVVTLQNGARLVIARKFEAEEALRILEKEKISVQFCVPTIYEREIECYENLRIKPQLDHLRTGMIAGAPGIRRCIEWFDRHLNCRLLNAYGMTEASGLAMADYYDPEEVRYSSCGHVLKQAELAVTDENGCFVPPCTTGEIVCKGSGLMLGYFNQESETAASMTSGGWFRTGDIGHFDQDGILYVTGRRKDIIIRAGYKIAPYEIERIYNQDFISELCVVSFPDDELYERIALFVALKHGNKVSPQSLRDYAAQHLAKFKVPDVVILLDELPKLPNGKIDKKRLKLQASLYRGNFKEFTNISFDGSGTEREARPAESDRK